MGPAIPRRRRRAPRFRHSRQPIHARGDLPQHRHRSGLSGCAHDRRAGGRHAVHKHAQFIMLHLLFLHRQPRAVGRPARVRRGHRRPVGARRGCRKRAAGCLVAVVWASNYLGNQQRRLVRASRRGRRDGPRQLGAVRVAASEPPRLHGHQRHLGSIGVQRLRRGARHDA